jgi:hypothetical protein
VEEGGEDRRQVARELLAEIRREEGKEEERRAEAARKAEEERAAAARAEEEEQAAAAAAAAVSGLSLSSCLPGDAIQGEVGLAMVVKNTIEPLRTMPGPSWSRDQQLGASGTSPYIKKAGGGTTRQAQAAAQRRQHNVLAVGDRVLAKFEGSEEFFDGVIEGVNRDQTFVVAFDDGDLASRVPRAHIVHAAAAVAVRSDERSSKPFGQHACAQLAPEAPPPTPAPPLSSSAAPATTSTQSPQIFKKWGNASLISVGQRVLARFEGSDDFFDGVVARCNGNGTFRVEFDDGDVDDQVAACDMAAPAAAASDMVRVNGSG